LFNQQHWLHIVDLLYSESVQRCAFKGFIEMLAISPHWNKWSTFCHWGTLSENNAITERAVDATGEGGG
jgi:hypothetical protein